MRTGRHSPAGLGRLGPGALIVGRDGGAGHRRWRRRARERPSGSHRPRIRVTCRLWCSTRSGQPGPPITTASGQSIAASPSHSGSRYRRARDAQRKSTPWPRLRECVDQRLGGQPGPEEQGGHGPPGEPGRRAPATAGGAARCRRSPARREARRVGAGSHGRPPRSSDCSSSLARCSTSIPTSPSAQRSPMRCSAGNEDLAPRVSHGLLAQALAIERRQSLPVERGGGGDDRLDHPDAHATPRGRLPPRRAMTQTEPSRSRPLSLSTSRMLTMTLTMRRAPAPATEPGPRPRASASRRGCRRATVRPPSCRPISSSAAAAACAGCRVRSAEPSASPGGCRSRSSADDDHRCGWWDRCRAAGPGTQRRGRDSEPLSHRSDGPGELWNGVAAS